ncbi:hypothetical protein GQR58_028193 [Nymphon striatum]|nr:hypothetical protein GQR58_028193 [Nymphon striatum]
MKLRRGMERILVLWHQDKPIRNRVDALIALGQIDAAVRSYRNTSLFLSNNANAEEIKKWRKHAAASINNETIEIYNSLDIIFKQNNIKPFKYILEELAKPETIDDYTGVVVSASVLNAVSVLAPSRKEYLLAGSRMLRESGKSLKLGLSAKGEITDSSKHQFGISQIDSALSLIPKFAIHMCEEQREISQTYRKNTNKIVENLMSFDNQPTKANVDDVYALAAQIEEIAKNLPDRDQDISPKVKSATEVIGFTDYESKHEFVSYLDAILSFVNNEKLTKKEQGQPIHFTLLVPLLSLILGVIGIYLYFDQFRLLSITLGSLWVLSSLFFFLKHLIRPPKVVSWASTGKTHPKVCRIKHAAIAYSVLAAVGTIQVVSSFYLPDLKSPTNLYKDMKKKGVNYSIREFLEGESNKTPLISALQKKDEQLAVSLVSSGVDITDKYVGETALDIAIKNNLDKAVEVMLKENAPTSNKKNLLIRAIKAGGISHENLDKLMVIVDDINYVDENGLTALGNAIVKETEPEVIQCMLEMGASQDVRIKHMSPLEYSQKLGNKRLTRLLSKY